MWDVFISHASEDKDAIVGELAEKLKEYELSVWYDKFELKMGDSLSRSIDKGLLMSRYGLLILSPNFFSKGWTDYELRSLLSKEIASKGKVILPIWHNIELNDVMDYSPYLADKFALSTSIGLDELAYKIVEVIKPELVNSHAIIQACRTYNGPEKLTSINIKNIKKSDIRHESLPTHLIIASKLICTIFNDVMKCDYRDFVMDFARDADYDHEFLLWSAMACTYVDFINSERIDAGNRKLKVEVFAFLLGYVNGQVVDIEKWSCGENILSKYQCEKLIVLFAQNHDEIFEFFDDSMKEKYKKILQL